MPVPPPAFARALPVAVAVVSVLLWAAPRVVARQDAPAPAGTRAAAPGVPQAGKFELQFDPAVRSTAFSGRVYVVLVKGENARPPRLSMGDWFGGTQVLAWDVKDGAPELPLPLKGEPLGYPDALVDLAPGVYTVQAVARVSLDSPRPGRGDGDLYSDAATVRLDPVKSPEALKLTLNHAVKARAFKENDSTKLLEIVSPSLSAFAGREIKLRAGVVLPQGWKDDPAAHYPTVYFLGGFGSDHFSALRMGPMIASQMPGALLVVPDPTCYRGYCAFADSENNGPWGKAFIEELVPDVERRFHGTGGAGRADGRFVTGISSGGWASLWLQVTYPDSFAGCWSHCPDPVDFRDFQRINLYAPNANMYKDEAGERRPIARRGGEVSLWYDDFIRQETVMGPGGQIHSFEAVFSPRGADGLPTPLFDRATGAVDPAVARSWEKYDIQLVLRRNWAALAPKLAGKLHIYAGGDDNFYLDGAVEKLAEALKELGSDAHVEIVPDMPHTIYPAGVEDMAEAVKKASGEPAKKE